VEDLAMPVSEQTYRQVAMEDPEGHWELHCGRLRRKPEMTTEHDATMHNLGFLLYRQPNRGEFVVRINTGRARRLSTQYYIPDVCVVPARVVHELLARPGTFAVFEEPLALVAEVWSPSTGEYDLTDKLRDYRRHSDLEFWLIHPYERTLTAWRRQPDGTYTETLCTAGAIQPVALPDVTIQLAALFEWE
jgi:Uma2 family endonuclease